MAKVILDAAYGGRDPGYVYGNRLKKNDNLKLALAVGKILEGNNIEVAYTRTEDRYVNLIERAKIANHEGGDVLVTFYRMRGASPFQTPCISFFITEKNGVGELVSNNMAKQLQTVGFHNMGTEILNNILLTSLNMPVTMARIGFIDSDENNMLFDTRFDDIANAIATAIMDSLEVIENDMQTQSNTNCKSCTSCKSKNMVSELNNMKRIQDCYHLYKIQVGVYRNYNDAINFQYKLYQLGFSVELIPLDDYFSILIGDFSDLDEAVKLDCLLKRRGYDTLIIAK